MKEIVHILLIVLLLIGFVNTRRKCEICRLLGNKKSEIINECISGLVAVAIFYNFIMIFL